MSSDTVKNILIIGVIGGGIYLFWKIGGFGLIEGASDLIGGFVNTVKDVGSKVGGGSLMDKANKEYANELGEEVGKRCSSKDGIDKVGCIVGGVVEGFFGF